MKQNHLKNDNATTEARQKQKEKAFHVGRVDIVFPDRGDIDVRLTEGNHVVCDLPSKTVGDISVPSSDDRVLIGKKADGTPTILASLTDDFAIEEGERIVGHSGSDTHLYFRSDGAVLVIPDGQSSPITRIDDDGIHVADQQIVTDIDVSTDADGHVTDVTPTYTTTISL